MDIKQLIAELRRDEGVKYSPYLDTVGIQTVGVGHNLKAKPLPTGWNFPLTDAQVDLLLMDDINVVISGLTARAPWYVSLTDARQRVLVNMGFNLGIPGLMAFKNTLAMIQSGQYSKASDAMLQSKWAKQVGARAIRLAKMMREGR